MNINCISCYTIQIQTTEPINTRVIPCTNNIFSDNFPLQPNRPKRNLLIKIFVKPYNFFNIFFYTYQGIACLCVMECDDFVNKIIIYNVLIYLSWKFVYRLEEMGVGN